MLTNPEFAKRPLWKKLVNQILERVLIQNNVGYYYALPILKQPAAARYPDLLEKALKNTLRYDLLYPNHQPDLLRVCGNQKVTWTCLKEAFDRGVTFEREAAGSPRCMGAIKTALEKAP